MNSFDQQFSIFFFNIEVGAWKESSWGKLLVQLSTQKGKERERDPPASFPFLLLQTVFIYN